MSKGVSQTDGGAGLTDGGRIIEVDALRGVAIILMVIYHFFFDLEFFGIMGIDLSAASWVLFQRLIAVMFLSLVGVGLVLSESRNREGYARHLKRGLFLAVIAGAITIATWIYPHDGYIQFGIIHLIALSVIIAPLFFRFGRWNLVFGVVFIILGLWFGHMTIASHLLFWAGITDPGYHALDHYPIFPWFGVVLVGISLGKMAYPGNVPRPFITGEGNGIADNSIRILVALGRNSLMVYLVHQPIIIGLLILLMFR